MFDTVKVILRFSTNRWNALLRSINNLTVWLYLFVIKFFSSLLSFFPFLLLENSTLSLPSLPPSSLLPPPSSLLPPPSSLLPPPSSLLPPPPPSSLLLPPLLFCFLVIMIHRREGVIYHWSLNPLHWIFFCKLNFSIYISCKYQ